MGVIKSIVLLFKKNKTITLKRPGDFLQYYDFSVNNIQKLTIKGPICKKDLIRIVDIAKKFGNLQHLDIQETNEIFEISNKQFKGCDNLETIILPNTLLRIGESAFEGCRSLRDIQIPKGLQIISKSAFYGCCSLKFLHIPENVKNIGNWALTCSNLTSIQVDKNNKHYKTINDILYTHDESILLKYPSHNDEKSFIVPSGVTKIACAAFQDTTELKKITLPLSLKQIEDRAFYNSSIKEIVIPKGVEKIGKMAFSHCSTLERAKIPGTIHELGDRAFTECHKLKEVDVEYGITGIGDNVFANCNSITSLELPETAYIVND